MFKWTRAKTQQLRAESGAAKLARMIDAAVPPYLERVDQGALVYPACKRRSKDTESDIRSVWAHSRLEAVRYLTMVPGRRTELLIEPAHQPVIFEAFLRNQPHEDTVVEFTGVAADDLVLAITAGLNWINLCALAAGVDRSKISGTHRNFRRIISVGQQWWSLDGAQVRAAEMFL